MVTTGLSKPYIGKYQNSSGTIKYTGGMKLGRAVELSIEVESADDNSFYADNIVAETDNGTMMSATATATIDGMEDEVAAFALGLPEATEVQAGGTQVEAYDYGDNINPPDLGLGFIRRTMMNGVTKYQPILLTRVKMSIPGNEFATQEDQIDWQTQEIPVPILRDDTANRRWKRVFARQTTKAAALNILKGYLKIVEA